MNNVEPVIRGWQSQIRDSVGQAEALHRDAVSIQMWDDAVDDLLDRLADARDNS